MSRDCRGGPLPRPLFLALWLVLGVGCTALQPPAPVAEEVQPGPAGLGAVAYFAWLESAPPDEANAELARLSACGEGPVERVQRALLLSASAVVEPEREREARGLLDALAADTASDARELDYLEFARVWRRVLVLRENLAYAAAFMRQAREDMRSTDANLRQVQQDLEAAQATREDSAQQIRELETQIQSLKRQIEALTTIEQQLIEREQSQDQ